MTPNAYSDVGPAWCEAIIDQLNGTAFDVGIESDKKRRGAAVNVSVMDCGRHAGPLEALPRAGRPAGEHLEFRKSYRRLIGET